MHSQPQSPHASSSSYSSQVLHPYARSASQYDHVVKIEEDAYTVGNPPDRVTSLLIVTRRASCRYRMACRRVSRTDTHPHYLRSAAVTREWRIGMGIRMVPRPMRRASAWLRLGTRRWASTCLSVRSQNFTRFLSCASTAVPPCYGKVQCLRSISIGEFEYHPAHPSL